MKFWLNDFILKIKIPYPIFFGLVALFLYLIGIFFMIKTGNLQSYLSEPRWIVASIFGPFLGILIIFTFREFTDSLNQIEHLIESDNIIKTKEKLLHLLTHKAYWIMIAFWLFYFYSTRERVHWFEDYNGIGLILAYHSLQILPMVVLGGIYFFMIPIGLTLAYRSLCLKTQFKNQSLSLEWHKPFGRFKRFITLTMLGAAIVVLFPPTIWSERSLHTVLPIDVSLIALIIAAIILPHYFFHKLFSRIKNMRVKDFQSKVSQISIDDDKNISKRILLLLEKGEVEKLKTWLMDIKVLGEVLVVALLHVVLLEVLTALAHG